MTMPHHTHPTCPTHGTRLQCPACVASRPRAPLSPAEQQRRAAILATARARRSQLAAERRAQSTRD